MSGARSSTRATRRCSCCASGHALHKSGYAAHSLEEILQKVCDRLGIIGQFFTTPTAIMASFGPLDHQQTHLIRVQPGELNLGRLSALDDVVQARARRDADAAGRVGADRQDPDEEADVSRGGCASSATRIVSAAGCRFLGGGLRRRRGRRLGGPAHRPDRAARSSGFTITSHVFELTASFVASALVSFVGGARACTSRFRRRRWPASSRCCRV